MTPNRFCPICKKTQFNQPGPSFNIVPIQSFVWIVEPVVYCSVCEVYVPERNLMVVDV